MAKAPRVPGATTTSEADAPAGTEQGAAAPETPAAPKAEPLPETPKPAMPAGTPNAIDVDMRTLTAPVLTRQGWLCPPDKVKG